MPSINNTQVRNLGLRWARPGIGFGIGIAAYLLGVRVSSSAVIGPTVAALATLIPFLYAAVVEDLPPVLALHPIDG